jgi:hypothetical protein
MKTMKEDPVVSGYHQTLTELAASPIVNLTGISNTDLKLQYGAPNIDLLSRYDQCYTTLVRTLQSLGETLYESGYPQEACLFLEFAISTRTDISASYKLLIQIYKQLQTPEKIKELLPVAESLNSGMKKHILNLINEELSSQ